MKLKIDNILWIEGKNKNKKNHKRKKYVYAMELSKQTKSQCYNSFIVVVVVSNKTLKQCDFNI